MRSISSAFMLVLVATLAQAASPKVHLIEYPGSTETYLLAVSDADLNNEVIGVGFYLDSQGVQHGFMVQDGEFTTVDDPNGTNTRLEGVNGGQVAVGYYTNTSGNAQAFEYTRGVFTDIFPGDNSYAFGINERGDVVGEYLASNGLFEGWILDGSSGDKTIEVPNSTFTLVFDINSSKGLMTVQWGDSAGNVNSSLYNGRIFTASNVPGAVNSYIYDINESGDTVYSWTDASGIYHGAVALDGKYTEFDIPGCTNTYAEGINNLHMIAGVCQTTMGHSGFYLTY